jgi:hypothetical protein
MEKPRSPPGLVLIIAVIVGGQVALIRKCDLIL